MKIFGVLGLFHIVKVSMPIYTTLSRFSQLCTMAFPRCGVSSCCDFNDKVQVGCCCIASSDSSVLRATCSFSWCDMLVRHAFSFLFTMYAAV